MKRDYQGRYRRPTGLDHFLRLMGIAFNYAFGTILLYIFYLIVVKGYFGYEDNKYILWAELGLAVPIYGVATYNLVRYTRRLARARKRR